MLFRSSIDAGVLAQVDGVKKLEELVKALKGKTLVPCVSGSWLTLMLTLPVSIVMYMMG